MSQKHLVIHINYWYNTWIYYYGNDFKLLLHLTVFKWSITVMTLLLTIQKLSDHQCTIIYSCDKGVITFEIHVFFLKYSFDRSRTVDCNANTNATRTTFSIYAAQTVDYDHDVHDNKIVRSNRPESMFACNQIPPLGDGNCDGKTNFEFFDEMEVHMYRGNVLIMGFIELIKEGSIKPVIIRVKPYHCQ